MSFSHHYVLFGGVSEPTGTPADYRGAYMTQDEAVQHAANQGLAWFWVAVWRPSGLTVAVEGPKPYAEAGADGDATQA